ncbi:WD and tetratricopeptide repeats protein 1-like isoform X3 [Eriocheir sinensis]|uniref:WD and tetratricopeptide repeats protein 1-like isoform X3 n=1 Tax=Eriocheir sinensis TaxID=95602 RepID=UPI0021C6EF13|nr:WD and tetratricopeptide repeats protein 1-like isoform X3 [Eriocheir sinensis]
MEVPTLGHPPTDARDPNALAHLGSSTYRPLFRKPSKKLSFLQLQRSREIEQIGWHSFKWQNQMTHSLVSRLGIMKELEGHRGCVNCIEFNSEGSLLLSGSDDYSIILWDVYRQKRLKILSTGHRGNIFSVKFQPQSGDRVAISGAGDGQIEVREVESEDVTHICTCHEKRVKRIATVPTQPNNFYSASEDGTVMLYDMRAPHTCNSQTSNILIDLRRHAGSTVECRCITIHPARPELIAVGVNDPFIRIYDRRMIKVNSSQYFSGASLLNHLERNNYNASHLNGSSDNLPPGCVQYLVPGHLPDRLREFHRQGRTLSTTYLTYSADGSQLLANLGGEHIYLFHMANPQYPRHYAAPSATKTRLYSKESEELSNGVCKSVSANTNGISSHLTEGGDRVSVYSYPPVPPLTPRAESLKARANQAFAAEKYITGLQLYNQAAELSPNSAVLYSNRAAALIKRKWDGDIYAALRDCFTALDIDPHHVKAHFRLARCLHQLGREEEAKLCLEEFMKQHPDHSTSPACTILASDIAKAIINKQREEFPPGPEIDGENDIPFPTPSAQEQSWRAQASDYQKYYCGHCNTLTDIKEAIFLGSDGKFIAAGSDDGNLFVWDSQTTNLIRVLPGDESIVNCVQAHPHTCLLATSGIESVVKLWAPLPQTDKNKEPAVDMEEIAQANQQRMCIDHNEVIFMQVDEARGVGFLFSPQLSFASHQVWP